ncbi:MAG: hypothetical protein KIH08_15115, partial [Candidatus Freyarchaeota archaeon]|nr:hypothetical protein [Candidatus Jordarchaeia archaeon]
MSGFSLKRLRWSDVFVFKGEYEVVFPERGLVLLEGLNEDTGGSNGSGKTSFLNLVSTVLFEENGSGLVKDKVVHRGCSGGFIECEFNDYRVLYRRGRGVSDWLVYRGDEVLKGKRLGETREILVNLVGMDYRRYRTMVHLIQGSTLGFVGMSGGERLSMMSEVLGVDDYNRASVYCGEVVRDLEVGLDKCLAELNRVMDELRFLEGAVVECERVMVDAGDIFGRRDGLRVEVGELEERYKGLVREFSQLKTGLDGGESQRRSLLAYLKSLEGEKRMALETLVKIKDCRVRLEGLLEEEKRLEERLVDIDLLKRMVEEREQEVREIRGLIGKREGRLEEVRGWVGIEVGIFDTD